MNNLPLILCGDDYLSFFSYVCICKTALKQPVVISLCYSNLVSMTSDLIGLVVSPPAMLASVSTLIAFKKCIN